MYSQIKQRVYEIVELNRDQDLASDVFNGFIIILIILNVLAVILETENSLSIQYGWLFSAFEIFSVAVFSIEYLIRLWVCNIREEYRGLIRGRIKYAFSAMAIIDLLAILPFYIPMVIPFDLRFLRLFRLFRIFRLFKLARYSESLQTIKAVLINKKEELTITIFIGVIVLIISSSLMYYAEHDAQPDKFSSIPDTMYWGVVTLTTIGYGDMYPITPLGKFFGSIIAVTGIGMFALPAGILGSGFMEEMQKKREKQVVCPHCGNNINEKPISLENQIDQKILVHERYKDKK